MESPEIPQFIDNCINHCPSGDFFHTPKEVTKFCIERKCPGPIVQERIVGIGETVADEDTATTLVRVCGSNLSSRTHEGLRPEGYAESQDEGADIDISNDETILVHEFTQEELRQKNGSSRPF